MPKGIVNNPTGKGGRKWVKGVSGNPGGRPAGLHKIQELARKHTPEAIKTLVSIMKDAGQTGNARVSAASVLLDRGWGKPTQPIEGEIGVNLTLGQILANIDGADTGIATTRGSDRKR